MAEVCFQDYIDTQDIFKAKEYLKTNLNSDKSLIKTINELLFTSALSCRNDQIGDHPLILMNSIKNIIGDDRENPSLILLEFAIDYLFSFEFRKNDQKKLNDLFDDGTISSAFIGDLEDACQNGNWMEANDLAAYIFIASDNSRGVLDILAELALQDPERNAIFVFHLLRAFQFQEIREDNWTYINCLLEYLSYSDLPDPHDYSTKTPMMYKDEMIKRGDLVLFSSVERIWNGDYVRIRGYRRELSHWLTKPIKNDSGHLESNLNHWVVKGHYGKKFISIAENIVQSEKYKSEKVEELVILESIRALSKTASKEQLVILGARMYRFFNHDYW